MRKNIISVPILALALANLVLAIRDGFNPLSIVALTLAFIVLVWDIVEVIRNGRKK
ncbi:hypothetical protein CAGA_23780 [Caproiciproducens galactitolivorans]|uniref:Uncharacterized protein n=1 Tax=Caproiciproducens galactitolivorans TaxID=642589 RepID=A0A4Z0Y6H4_9FIRM|nr:hypothetical protein CAGA_23780 [Caproiciproducens galactitolivorans]